MSVLQSVALLLVTVAGTAVVATGDPLRQTLVLGLFGLTLSLLFFTYQAPDVALSEIVVGSVALPVIIVAALRRLREQQAAEDEKRGE